jgi:hypothetical protein
LRRRRFDRRRRPIRVAVDRRRDVRIRRRRLDLDRNVGLRRVRVRRRGGIGGRRRIDAGGATVRIRVGLQRPARDVARMGAIAADGRRKQRQQDHDRRAGAQALRDRIPRPEL